MQHSTAQRTSERDRERGTEGPSLDGWRSIAGNAHPPSDWHHRHAEANIDMRTPPFRVRHESGQLIIGYSMAFSSNSFAHGNLFICLDNSYLIPPLVPNISNHRDQAIINSNRRLERNQKQTKIAEIIFLREDRWELEGGRGGEREREWGESERVCERVQERESKRERVRESESERESATRAQ